ncbi:nuclear transport factor 2 family protein [Xanthomonas sp. Kuri4-1]
MSRLILTVVLLGLALAGGPAPCREVPASDSSAQLPDAPLPPELDRVLRDYEQAWRTGDASALSKLFAEDGFVLQNNQPPIRGRRAIASAYAATFNDQGGGHLQLRALAFDAEDESGYIIGAYRYGGARDAGKFTLTLRRLPGQPWQIFSDMDNSSTVSKRADLP